MGTAGGLVFGGSDEGNFYALDAMTGKSLWDFQTGGAMASNPVSFRSTETESRDRRGKRDFRFRIVGQTDWSVCSRNRMKSSICCFA